MTEHLLYQHSQGVMEVTLNAPATLNALTASMAAELLHQLRLWQTNDEVACIVIRGSGDKAFCAGGDIQQLYQHMAAQNYTACADFFATEYKLDYALHSYSKPVIAWVDGIVMGGGMGIMQGCSHRVVTERVSMAMPETHIGLIPDVGSGDFLNQREDRLAWLLPLTGGQIQLAEVMYLGLADYYVGSARYDQLLGLLQQGQDVTQCLQKIQQPAAASWLDNYQQSLAAALAESAQATLQTLRTIEDAAMRELCRRMDYASPLAQNAAWRHLLSCQAFAAGSRRREFALQQEYNLVMELCRHGEFAEGIRALIIDKDKAPQWSAQREFWFTENMRLELEEI